MIWASKSTELMHALEVAPAGETVQLHAGTFTAPPGGFVVPRGMRIEGAHPLRNRFRGGTIIEPASPDDSGLVIPGGVDNVTITDLILRGPERPGRGDGIRLIQTGTTACVELHNVSVWGFGRDGLHFEITKGSVDLLLIEGCLSHHNGRHGLYVAGPYGPIVRGGYYSRNGGAGVMFDLCGAVAVLQVGLEANQQRAPAGDYAPELYLRGGSAHNVDGCRFEDWARAGGSHAAITVENAKGVRIVGCSLVGLGDTPCRGVLFRNQCDACEIGLNTWVRVSRPTDIDASCTSIAVTKPQAIVS